MSITCILTVTTYVLIALGGRPRPHHLFDKHRLTQNVGPINIMEDGQMVQRYVVSQQPGSIDVSGSTITLRHNGGAQIAKVQQDNYSPDMYQEYQLANRTFGFNVDISTIDCSCDAAITVVAMPGYDSNNQPTPGDGGTYYCDANQVNGVFCWEYDFMEANKYVTQTTPHQCNAPAGGYISNCDGGGCDTNSYRQNPNGMCPDGSCTINTSQQFRQEISFYGSDNGYRQHVRLTQNGQVFEFDVCNDYNYLQSMQQPLEYGMAIAMVYWGDGYNEMTWLDGMTGCQGDCPGTGQVIFSNITIGPIVNYK